ncbi:unnamed protein product, partial [Didymodactylos carnosus]
NEKYGSRKSTIPRSVMNDIDERAKTTTASNLYRELVTNPQLSYLIKNKQQIADRRKAILRSTRVSRDEIFNIFELHLNNPIYIKYYTLVPYLNVVCLDDESVLIFKKLLKQSKSLVVLSYDTTFQLTDAYVSGLVYRNSMFVDRPAILLGCLIHETKHETNHDIFVRQLQLSIPEMDTKCVLVTDDETAFQNSFRKFFPHLRLFQYWNHKMKNIRRSMYKAHKKKQEKKSDDNVVELIADPIVQLNTINDEHLSDAESSDELTDVEDEIAGDEITTTTSIKETLKEKASRYISDVKSLFSNDSLLSFEAELGIKKKQWDKPFIRYFDNRILSKLSSLEVD